ncbi:MAG: hypothetical protein ABJN22_00985 [Litorimonas sp.]
MEIRHTITLLTFALALAGCANTASVAPTDRLTRAEAKSFACPISVLDAGASAEDCGCVETHLYEIGKKPGALEFDPTAPQSEIGTSSGRRDIAIGLLRMEAFEYCGLFDPDHIVSKNL